MIPFLSEARTLLDWICIKTSLSLYEWFKMEDIYSDNFTIKVSKSNQYVSEEFYKNCWFFSVIVSMKGRYYVREVLCGEQRGIICEQSLH